MLTAPSSAPARLAAFGGALLLAFGGAFGVGTAVGSPTERPLPADDHLTEDGHAAEDAHATEEAHADDDAHAAEDTAATGDTPATEDTHAGTAHPAGAESAGAEAAGAEAADAPGGLLVSDRGYTLELAEPVRTAAAGTAVAFVVRGADGQPVTDYTFGHEALLHLVAVRRDLTGYQHVHPTLDGDGTWRTSLDLAPGTWRLFADFVPAAGQAAGQRMTLGADLAVAGDHTPAPLPSPTTTDLVDGYTVTLDGALVPGEESTLTLDVSRDGRPVTDLQPYLGSYGHLVALRAGDLAYLHVHATGEPQQGAAAGGPQIAFAATAPSPGTYRLFLDFRHGDVVRTAELTARAGPDPLATTEVDR